MIEIILAVFLGIVAGAFLGIIPGFHINLLTPIILSFLLYKTNISEISSIVFLVALATSQIFFSFIPAILLGAPDEDNFLSTLPGHELLNSGKGYEAIVLSLYGALGGLLLLILLSPIFFLILPLVFPYTQNILSLLILITIFFLIYFEKTSKWKAIFIFLLSGFLGIATLNLPIKQPLLALFTGLFGLSSMLSSILKKENKIVTQEVLPLKNIKLKREDLTKSICSSLIASPFCSLIPAIGSGQSAIIGNEIIGELDRRGFLFLVGMVNILTFGLSFITFFTINKARNGLIAGLNQLDSFNMNLGLVIITTIIFSGFISFFLSIETGKTLSNKISKINYRTLSILIIIFLTLVVFILSGWIGLLLLFTSTFLGLLSILLGIRRTHLMGSLLLTALILNF